MADENATQTRISNMMQQAINEPENQSIPVAPVATPPARTEEPPATPAPTPTPAATTTTKPAAETPADDNKDNDSVPLFLRKPAETQQTQTQPVVTTPATDVPDEAFYSRLSALTKGAIKSEKEMVGFIQGYNGMVEQAEKGWEPKFANERAKKVHEYLSQNTGNEPEAAIRLLRALKFNPEGKSEKEILFQAFLQDPKNADLGETEAGRHFEAKHNRTYALLNKPDEELTPEQREDKLILQRDLKLAVRDASDGIKKVQADFESAEEQPRQVAKEVTDAITKAVGGFQGLKLAFSDNPQEGDILNVPFSNPDAAQELLSEILNPDDAYNSMVEQFSTEKGMNWTALVQEAYERKNHKELRQQAYDHGYKMGELARINKVKNASTQKDISKVASPAAAQQKSWAQTWQEASGGR